MKDWDVKDGEAQEGGGIFQKVDVTSAASVESAVEEVAARLGAVYVLVNNAGILRDGQLVKYQDGALAGVMSDEQFDVVIGVNLKGVFTCTRLVSGRWGSTQTECHSPWASAYLEAAQGKRSPSEWRCTPKWPMLQERQEPTQGRRRPSHVPLPFRLPIHLANRRNSPSCCLDVF